MYLHRRFAIRALFLLCLSLAFTSPCQGEGRHADSAGEIVAALLKAYGGSVAVSNIRSVTARGRIMEFLNGKSGGYDRYFERPGKLRIEVMPEQGGETRILNGDHGWQKIGRGFQPVSTLEIQAMNYQYSYLDLPMGLVGEAFQVTYAGTARHSGREMYLLLIAPPHAPTLRVLIDAKTHLIARISANFGKGMMGTGELATEYSDYRRVGGVLFPHKLTNFAGEMKLSEIVLSEIQINRQVPAVLFAPQ